MILNALHTDRTEVAQLLSWRMIPYAAGLILLPALLLAAVDIDFGSSARYLASSLVAAVVAIGVAASCLFANLDAIQRAGTSRTNTSSSRSFRTTCCTAASVSS